MSSSQITKTSTSISATRTTYRTPAPFATVESRLRASICPKPNAKDWPTIARDAITYQSPNGSHAEKLANFRAQVTSRIGPHGFMYFYEINHGSWLAAFYPHTTAGRALQCKRFILGNPLIAITMLEHDLDAGLYVPVELMLVEEEEGGTRCVYQLPSGLVGGYEGASGELKGAAEVLDAKLEELVSDVMRVDGEVEV